MRGTLLAGQPAVTRREDGSREEVEFFGDGEQLLFGCRHVPAGELRGGVLVCSPILSDFGANYQREVRLARRLAAEDGILVQRFHPRGTGQSDGDGVDVTLDSMIADAQVALAHLRERVSEPLAVLGTRFGALVAAAIASELDGAPVVLWEPTVDSRRFLREGLRARSVHRLRAGTAAAEDPEDELARKGFIDLLGCPVGPGLYAERRGLIDQMGSRPRPVLLLQFEQRDELRDEYRHVVDQWDALGFAVTARCCPCDETWWYVPDRLAPVEEIVATTAAWLRALP